MVDERADEHADVFGGLADEKRLDILLAILKQYRQSGPVSFSEALEAADIEDSGHFSYHLDKLEAELIWEQNELYFPTTAARELLPVVLGGR